MKKLIFTLLLLSSTFIFSQGIVVDTTSLSVPALVQNVLMQNECSNARNFQSSKQLGIGKFTNTNPVFPISEGIIIRNGYAKHTEGKYTGLNESSQITNSGDADLQSISNKNGQPTPLKDVAYLQFEFTAVSNQFSFDFLFASNEYGQYQCGFSDVFAFILTDLTTGQKTNLAVIPGTSTPVSVKNIRDNAYNGSCASLNPNLFSRYNVTDAVNSAINMRGETVLLQAFSAVVPNRDYQIKLAIGDYNDTNFDSAVFIKGGSFTTTTNLGPDLLICQGETIVLDSKLDPKYTHSWTKNGSAIPGENKTTLNVTTTGIYKVIATLPGTGCEIKDEIIISDLVINSPSNISVCNLGSGESAYDLTQNDLSALGLNPVNYSLVYYASQEDVNNNIAITPESKLKSFLSAGDQKIFIKVIHISNNNATCSEVLSFDLLKNVPVRAKQPPVQKACRNNLGLAGMDLTTLNTKILDGQNSLNYIVTYHNTEADARANKNPLANFLIISANQTQKNVWVRVSNKLGIDCYEVTNFDLIAYDSPLVDKLRSKIIVCEEYKLLPLVNGNYFTKPKGGGTPLFAGDVINQPGIYYIFNGPNEYGCTNETSFELIVVEKISFPTTACGAYYLPSPPVDDFYSPPQVVGNFYTESGGKGTLLKPGTKIDDQTKVYFYATLNDGSVCKETSFTVSVFPLPPVDKLDNVVTCNGYILPVLTNGNYFTGKLGTGKSLNAGFIVNTSSSINIFSDNGNCKSETTFKVDIINASNFQPITACGNYTLPALTLGGYYDQPLGQGNKLPAGTVITEDKTVYYYAITTTSPNCTDELKYDIKINPVPEIDKPASVDICQVYYLPPLTSGNYFTAANGGGKSLKAGDIISSTQSIFVYAFSGGCPNEHMFDVKIKPLPPIDVFTDIFTCDPYTLPVLENGSYYTEMDGPNGTGKLVPVGTIITETQKLYIYNEWPDLKECRNESFFSIVFGGIDVGNFDDVNACDSYTLPVLNVGDYYPETGGKGGIIPPGTIITNTKKIYVYKIIGERLICSDEDDFIVNISKTPVLPNYSNVESCIEYSLPTLSNGNYFSGLKGTGTAFFAGDKITTSQKMYVYETAPDNINCNDQDDFNITIYPLKNNPIDDGVVCIDYNTNALLKSYELISGLDPNIYTIEWFLNNKLVGKGSNYIALENGDYVVKYTKNTPNVGSDCGYNPTSVLVEKSSPAVATVTVISAFYDIIDVIVNVNGYGDYEYQIDNGSIQTSNVFNNVASGEHKVTIIDKRGECTPTEVIAHVIKYPNYFTPNGDGTHDTWNIYDLAHQPESYIHIFDRHGKFLKQIWPSREGWDGNYNGNPMPSSDYWFEVYYNENNTDHVFRSHFSMKR